MKNINVVIDTSCGKKGLPKELLNTSLPSIWPADELNAFSLIALGTASPTYVGFTLGDTWAHQRYAAALDSKSTKLLLRPEWQDLDPHQKTILADEWGIGFSLLYLTENVALKHFSPTGWWLKAVEATLGKKLNIPRKKTGPPKLPDYIGIDAYGSLHALECKGTQQSHAILRKQINGGVDQVENLRSKSVLPPAIKNSFRGWMVGGLYVPQASSKEPPLLIIADPDFKGLADALKEIGGLSEVKQCIRLTMLCQQLMAIGLPRLATTLFNGRTTANEADFLHSTKGENAETRFMELRHKDGRLSKEQALRVFDVQGDLRKSAHIERNRSAGRVFNFVYSIPSKLLTQLTTTISKEGHVNRKLLNDILDEVAPIDTPKQKSGDFKKIQTKASGWIAESAPEYSLLRSPFGIEIQTSSYVIEQP